MKSNTVLKTLGTLSHLYDWMEESGYCDHNPFRSYSRGVRRRPDATVERPVPHSVEEFTRFLQVAWATDKLIFIALLLTSYAGLRRKELLGIKYGDLYLRFKALKVRKEITKEKKNKRSRLVIMPKALILFWALIPNMDPSQRVILLSPEEYNRRLAAVRETAGLPAWRKDKLRKNYSVLQQWLMVPLEIRKKLLGHDEESTVTELNYDGEADPIWADGFENLSPGDVLPGAKEIKPEDLV
jgi:integrase